jgi:Zn finger protein HypA/HybF involved in hydrogenase expression
MGRKHQTKTCPKCKNSHNKSGVYCSRTCANSRIFTEESRKKKSNANKTFWSSLSNDEKEHKKQLLKEISPNSVKNYLESLLTQDWDVLGIAAKRLRVIIEQKGKCNKCGISHWNEERITLEYEHIDGNNGNNLRENVEVLCPNCHSQTKTWRGRKNKSRQKRVENLLETL